MKRREFFALLGGSAVWPLAARAQQQQGMRRVGILMPYAKTDSEYESRVRAFRQELTKLGWTEGGNIQFDERWTIDDMDRVRAEAANLVASNPDVVIAIGGRVIPILMQLSRSVPIVVPGASDPVGIGWVKSMARPGGNLTGFTFLELSMFGKMLETLKHIAPVTARVALLYNPDNPNTVYFRRAFESAIGPLAIEPMVIPIHALADIEPRPRGFGRPAGCGGVLPTRRYRSSTACAGRRARCTAPTARDLFRPCVSQDRWLGVLRGRSP